MTMVEQFAADVQGVETELPVYGTFEGKQYIGSQSPKQDTQAFEDAGIIQKYDFEWVVRLSQFVQGPPEKNDTITISNVDYRVESIMPSPDGVISTYRLVQQN